MLSDWKSMAGFVSVYVTAGILSFTQPSVRVEENWASTQFYALVMYLKNITKAFYLHGKSTSFLFYIHLIVEPLRLPVIAMRADW